MKKIKRREFLRISALTTGSAILVGCAPNVATTAAPAQAATSTQVANTASVATNTPAPTATSVAIQQNMATSTPIPTVPVSKYNQAPMLADLEKSGKLPSVDKRLPENPMVIQPVDAVGKYGGAMHLLGNSATIGNVQMKFYDPPIRWKADLSGYEAGLAESYEWSADGKIFTFHFRKGLMWSDGEAFTMTDMKFWWEDLVNNDTYNKLYPYPWYFIGKNNQKMVTVSFPDDYTMVWTSSADPIYIAPYVLAQGFWEWTPLMKPMHYLKQFHTKYTPSAQPSDMEKYDEWFQNPDYPCLMAWHCTQVSDSGNHISYARNPYYWKVDTAGNQLPYIDTVEVDIVLDPQVALLQTSQGKFDVMFRGTGGNPNDIPFLTEQAKTGGYHLLQHWTRGTGSMPALWINQDYVSGGKNYANDTPEYAKEIHDLLRDHHFRMGLSLATNRQRLIDVLWNGVGTPVNCTISPQSWHFASPQGQAIFKEWQQAYNTYDSAKAASEFAAAGMKKGSDGFYTLPSGKPFTVIVDVVDSPSKIIGENYGAELKNQFEAAGIKTGLNNVIGLTETRMPSGFYMLRIDTVSELDLWTYPDNVFPVHNDNAFPLEGLWRASAGQQGIQPEPGSPAEKLVALYDKGLAEPDIQKRNEIVWEAVRIHIDEGPFVMGVSGDRQVPVVVKDYMRNILDFGVTGPWAPGTPGNQHLAQWWMDV
ncbi:MAG: ABC transporter substrate-binding protein [Anaerolineaceae bacterium]